VWLLVNWAGWCLPTKYSLVWFYAVLLCGLSRVLSLCLSVCAYMQINSWPLLPPSWSACRSSPCDRPVAAPVGRLHPPLSCRHAAQRPPRVYSAQQHRTKWVPLCLPPFASPVCFRLHRCQGMGQGNQRLPRAPHLPQPHRRHCLPQSQHCLLSRPLPSARLLPRWLVRSTLS
jgi:hypothetical protein